MQAILQTECAQQRQRLLAKVDHVREVLTAGAADAEAERTLPATSVAALRDEGLLALKLPAVLGGEEADPMLQLDVFEAIAQIDASAAWSVCIGNGAMTLCAYLPDQAIDAMFASGRIPTACGAFKPGRAEAVNGGYRVNGRWSWASGIRHAEWVAAHVLVDRGKSGPPRSLVVVVPRTDVTLHDNWQVAGLKGTGSCDFSINDLFVAEGFTFDLQAMDPVRGGPLYLMGFPGLLINEFMGFNLGVARHALAALIDLLPTKQRGYGPQTLIAERGVVQRALGESDLRLSAVRHLCVHALEKAWAHVCGGTKLTMDHQVELRGATALTTDTAVDVTTRAFRYGGGHSIFLDHALQRCLRDIQVGAAHMFVSDSAYELRGQRLLGMEVKDAFRG
jgi:indole-3-acetate monooxygenase